jgi:hypothetical protein
MAGTPPPVDPGVADALRAAAVRLAAELDQARLYQAAAYASMVADSIDHRCGQAVNDNGEAPDLELRFELDEHGRVWLLPHCEIVGRRLEVCAQMLSFLAAAGLPAA